MAYQTVNPATGAIEATFEDIGDGDLDRALDRADAAFGGAWAEAGVAGRARVLKRAAELMRGRADGMAPLITTEMGKLLSEAKAEVALSADILAYYADQAEALFRPVDLPVTDGGAAKLMSAPLGVLVGVQPWNFPYYQLARLAGPNLAAGNTLLVKHANGVPQCALAFEKLIADAGAPDGAYVNIFASNEQVARLLTDDRVRGVAVTGSERAGKAIAAEAGQACKKSILELGGADAMIVLADADLDNVVDWAVWGRMHNAGQSCVAAKRFIVEAPIADAFLERLRARYEALRPGDPMEAATTLAPLSSEGALKGILAQVERAVAGGAKLVMGGGRIDRAGFYMAPTILADVAPTNPAFREEFFGPVSLFFRAADAEAALALANDSPFGLGGSIFTADVAKGEDLAARMQTGMAFVNRVTWTAPHLPFGGVKISGYGRELSGLAAQEFVNKKLVHVSPPRAAAVGSAL